MENSSLVEVPVGLLKVGMYVAEVDRPWLETPFSTQGFTIESEADIDFIAEHCEYVYVDQQNRRHNGLTTPRFQPVERKAPSRSLKMTLQTAKVDFESASVAMERVFAELKRNRRVNLPQVQAAVEPLIKGVINNGEALSALMRMREKSDYFHEHAISTAVWAIILARHMGYDKDELKPLALGATLIDTGMINVPDHVLNKGDSLSTEELRLVRSHVRASVRMAEEAGVVDHRIIEIIACHHERHSGSGYPKKLSGADIPINARIVSIADVYDAMVTDRPHASALTSYAAIKELNRLAGAFFNPALVSAFTQVVGLFPTGAIVHLSSGEVGIVTAQNPLRRLHPEVLLILNANKEPYEKHVSLNLAKQKPESAQVSIVEELTPGSYGVEAEHYFL